MSGFDVSRISRRKSDNVNQMLGSEQTLGSDGTSQIFPTPLDRSVIVNLK